MPMLEQLFFPSTIPHAWHSCFTSWHAGAVASSSINIDNIFYSSEQQYERSVDWQIVELHRAMSGGVTRGLEFFVSGGHTDPDKFGLAIPAGPPAALPGSI